MPKFNLGGLIEGTAYGVLNEILAEFHSDDGFALPSRYEVVILPPQGLKSCATNWSLVLPFVVILAV